MKKTALIYLAAALSLFLVAPLCAQSRSIRDGIIHTLDRTDMGPHSFTIDARSGVVTLDGWVSTEADRALVERVARTQEGVRQVQNNLFVRGGTVSGTAPNEDWGERIKAELKSSYPQTTNYSIAVRQTAGGQVVLSGDVNSDADRAIIESVTARMMGVSNIDNELTVRPPPSDEVVASRLRAALEADPNVRMNSVDFDVRNGIAKFSGTTANHRDTDRILSIALMVPGVKDIHSDIRELSSASPMRR